MKRRIIRAKFSDKARLDFLESLREQGPDWYIKIGSKSAGDSVRDAIDQVYRSQMCADDAADATDAPPNSRG